MKKVLVTGAAGFIGFHVVKKLVSLGYNVVGIDSINDYYNVGLKKDRIGNLKGLPDFYFEEINICDKAKLDALFEKEKFDIVINLAAQAGVRYSIEKPYNYLDSNISGFTNILEACRRFPVKHLIFASSSSVYGANAKVPFAENDTTDHPLSLYAATKKANEALAHSYAALYGIPSTALRFFTVYGPWGRPDMAYFSFTDSIYHGKTIKVFNNGNMRRDFTYIDDIVNVIALLIDKQPSVQPDKQGQILLPSESYAPYKVYNIGNNNPVNLSDFIHILEDLIGKKAVIENLPIQKGDMLETYADIEALSNATGYRPVTDIRTGLTSFVNWYKEYFKIG
ncbi:capsular biosynthesis protein CpsI [Chitinophagaceae bacterium IBVUCB1]|nr:capsular biosynthesis protein CpsI [Chitinophagaceae bacterium IBVUCB1]